MPVGCICLCGTAPLELEICAADVVFSAVRGGLEL